MFSELINIGARSCYFVFSCCGRSNVFSNKNCLVMKNIATTVVAKPPTLSTKDPEGWTPLHEVTEMNFVFLSLKPLGGCIVSYCLGHLLDAMQIMTHIYIYIRIYIYILLSRSILRLPIRKKQKNLSSPVVRPSEWVALAPAMCSWRPTWKTSKRAVGKLKRCSVVKGFLQAKVWQPKIQHLQSSVVENWNPSTWHLN